MNGTDTLRPQMDRLQTLSLVIGLVVTALFSVGAAVNPDPSRFMRSYLLAFLFWVGIALGCSAILMLHHLVGGGWGLIIRRLLESGTRTTPLMALMMLPLLFGLPHLYSWTQAAPVAPGSLMHFKHVYLGVSFFIIRAAVYFSAWLILAY